MDGRRTSGYGELDSLAKDYFSRLAHVLPACCLSDDFYSLPRQRTPGGT